jgi:hypothetical protein
MIIYKNLEELKAADKNIYDNICDCVFPSDVKSEFMLIFGGDVHVIETAEDLSQISVGGVSLTDAVVEGFDVAEYVGTGAEYIMFVTINNNGGGPSYFIPKAVYDQNPNVEASLELFESGNASF